MKLVTWNIQWCRGCDGRVDPQRIVEHARAFADFDVLCLQEVAANFATLAGSAGEDQFARIGALLPGFTPVVGTPVDIAAPDGSRRIFGNMILSRLPVAQALRVQLPWPADPSVRSMPRMLVEALVQAPFGPLRIMTTHLEYYSPRQRTAQLEGLRAHHAQACAHALDDRAGSDSGDPFQAQRHSVSAILTGDFNLRPDDPLHARMAAPFEDPRVPPFDDAWQRLHPGRAQPPTVGVHDCHQWPDPFACDFVFATSDLRGRLRSVAVDGATDASDHQPMLIEIDD